MTRSHKDFKRNTSFSRLMILRHNYCDDRRNWYNKGLLAYAQWGNYHYRPKRRTANLKYLRVLFAFKAY